VEKYESVQFEGESLSMYVQSIRDAALVLRITETKTQIVQRIGEGLTPTQGARFVFQVPPSNFMQLEHLIVVDRNIAYADKTRKMSVSTTRAEAVVSNTSTTFVAESSRRPSSKKPLQGKLVVCFGCDKTGHFHRNCVNRFTPWRKPVVVASTQS
jgi:hypothetical protein